MKIGEKTAIFHVKMSQKQAKNVFFSRFWGEKALFCSKNGPQIDVKTAFLVLFRRFLGPKVYQMYQVCQS
jgi:hypothetical protein